MSTACIHLIPFYSVTRFPEKIHNVEDIRAQNFRNLNLIRLTDSCTDNYASKFLWEYREERNYFYREKIKYPPKMELGLLQIFHLTQSLIRGEYWDCGFTTQSSCMRIIVSWFSCQDYRCDLRGDIGRNVSLPTFGWRYWHLIEMVFLRKWHLILMNEIMEGRWRCGLYWVLWNSDVQVDNFIYFWSVFTYVEKNLNIESGWWWLYAHTGISMVLLEILERICLCPSVNIMGTPSVRLVKNRWRKSGIPQIRRKKS
jgi:hypothetical protein